jgi:hypothetical protein
MAVYVDWLADHGWVLRGRAVFSCHLLADTEQELHKMAYKIGLKRAWFQPSPPASAPHYDLTESRRKEAIEAGAIEFSKKGFLEWMRRRRS